MLYYLIIFIVVAEFALNTTLRVLNRRASHNPIPERLKGIYDEEAYRRQQAYSRECSRLGALSSVCDTLLFLVLFAFGAFAFFDHVARSCSTNLILQALLFFVIWNLISSFVALPFSVYSVFGIEQRYGFNRTTPRTFVLDYLKGKALTYVMLGVVMSVLILVYTWIPDLFWIVAWGCISIIQLFLQFVYSDLIVPLFNKQTPLQEGELRTAIEQFADKVDFKLQNIYVIDGSKRSSKANAYFTGFGSRKRIVLYDTLMEQLTTEEIVAVLAHEIGHYKHRHIVKGIFTSLLHSLLVFYLFGLVIGSSAVAEAAGCSEPSIYVNLVVFSMLLTPLDLVVGIFSSYVSRKHEWQADEFALRHGVGAPLASSLRKMSRHSLSNLTPHPWVVFTSYSHPTLLQRVEHLE